MVFKENFQQTAQALGVYNFKDEFIDEYSGKRYGKYTKKKPKKIGN